ncbi:MAG: RluA family pseudouridine synthase [Erysipelotrichaceae bacterium]|nr:RluA family pseudouridine synthase [Erysipelotrichaceae bacterium]
MKEIKIQTNDAGQRLDRFLSKAFPNLKKSAMFKAVRNKKIKVNRKRTTHDYRLQEGDVILLFLPPDMLEEKQKSEGVKGDLNVVYEDDSLLVANKPAGLLSQKDEAGDQDSLNGRILYYLREKGDWNPEREASFTPSICHRLDRNTKGLVIAAKTAEAARTVNQAIADHQIKKSYLARVQGKMEGHGTLEYWLKKDGTKALVKEQPADGYAKAVTHYTVLASSEKSSLVRLDLETGRFHQIRASLAHLGHPILNDVKYGAAGNSQDLKLQAYRLDLSRCGLDVREPVIELACEI